MREALKHIREALMHEGSPHPPCEAQGISNPFTHHASPHHLVVPGQAEEPLCPIWAPLHVLSTICYTRDTPHCMHSTCTHCMHSTCTNRTGHVHTPSHPYMCTSICMCVHTHPQAHMHILAQMHMHIHVCMCIHTSIHNSSTIGVCMTSLWVWKHTPQTTSLYLCMS